MTELTEKYLRNYLAKKSLVIAAEREVNESGAVRRKNMTSENVLRHSHAIEMLHVLDREADAALDFYVEHVRSEG